MFVDTPAARRYEVWTGFTAAVLANMILFAGLAHWTGFDTEGSSAVPAIGCGVTFVVGVLMMLPKQTWPLGLGATVGAVVAFALEVAVSIWLILQVTY